MTNFEKEYYILERDSNDSLPTPSPFHETAAREFREKLLAPDSPPLAFYNISKRWARRHGHPMMPEPPDVMFDFDNLLVRKPVRDTLLGTGISRILTHPAWYVHDDKTLHEDYWYVGFIGRFDCWDRKLSEYTGKDKEGDDDGEEGGTSLPPNIMTLRFNAQLLANTPFNERQLFVLDGCFSPGVVCHESLLPQFHGFENSGTRATLVEDY
jgi:hypothetical protein